jgi:hypothetical protein
MQIDWCQHCGHIYVNEEDANTHNCPEKIEYTSIAAKGIEALEAWSKAKYEDELKRFLENETKGSS